MPTIKAKAEFSVVSRNNELVMLRSTNFHTFSSGNDWGYSGKRENAPMIEHTFRPSVEFLDGNYLNSRRNDLLTDDRLRVYVRVILVDEKETMTSDLLHQPHHFHPAPVPTLPSAQPPPPPTTTTTSVSKSQPSTSSSSSSASSSSVPSIVNTHLSNSSSASSKALLGLFSNEKERLKSFELLSKQLKTLLDHERFTDVHIHIIPKQPIAPTDGDDRRKSTRSKRANIKQQHPSCSSCHLSPEKSKSLPIHTDLDHHEQSSFMSVTSKESESNNSIADPRPCPTSSTAAATPRRTTRSTTSLLSRLAQSSSEPVLSSSSSCTTSSVESTSNLCSSSSLVTSPTASVNCDGCLCHSHEGLEPERNLDVEQSHYNYSHITPLATFHVHKAILMARSSSFASQLRVHTRHGSNHSLKLPPTDLYIDDLDSSTVRAMLIYIYTGRLPTANDEILHHLNPIDLFRGAVRYNLHELCSLAKSTMLEVLKIDNAIEMLEVSDQANDGSLKQQILSFIRSNASAVSKTTTWTSFTKDHPQLVIDAFRSLVVPTTEMSSSTTKHHSASLTTTSKPSKYE